MTTNADAIVSLARLGEIARRANTADAEAAKACCAAAYGVDVVGLFLGDSYHPGGADLTRRLADLLALSPGERVLDVAAGIGTSALLLALERHVDVLGIDLGENQIDRARLRASVAGLARRARFELGDAERLTVDEGSFDAAVCECAFCTFPDKATAAAELARVVRPGGRIGISDVWLHPEHLDPELAGLAGRIACLADARPVDELCALLSAAGCTVSHVERHDQALLQTILQVQARLRALRIADLPILRRFNLRRGVDLAGRAAQAVRRGDAGYVLITATKP